MATMATMTSGLAVALLIGSVVHAEQTVTKKTEPITATVTIQSIDKANRLITIKDESGAEDMMLVGPAMTAVRRAQGRRQSEDLVPRVAGLPGAKARRSDHDCR